MYIWNRKEGLMGQNTEQRIFYKHMQWNGSLSLVERLSGLFYWSVQLLMLFLVIFVPHFHHVIEFRCFSVECWCLRRQVGVNFSFRGEFCELWWMFVSTGFSGHDLRRNPPAALEAGPCLEGCEENQILVFILLTTSTGSFYSRCVKSIWVLRTVFGYQRFTQFADSHDIDWCMKLVLGGAMYKVCLWCHKIKSTAFDQSGPTCKWSENDDEISGFIHSFIHSFS